MTAPSGAKCQVGVGNVPAAPFPPAGGAGSISVSTARDCTWSVSADASWVAPSTTNGQGPGTVAFTIAANPVPASRSGALIVASQRVPLSQAAAPCRFDLSKTADTIPANGGRLSIGVTTLAGCAWTAASGVGWIAIQSGQSGNANGTVVLAVAANTGAQRVGQVNVAGQSYTVTQAEAAGAPPTAPPGATPAQVSGVVQNVAGRCPTLQLTVAGRTVFTTGDTEFKGFKCSDVKRNVQVSVTGIAAAGGPILAAEVRKAG